MVMEDDIFISEPDKPIDHPIPSRNAVRNGTGRTERPFSVPVPEIPDLERTGRPRSPKTRNGCLFRQFRASRSVRNGVRNGTSRPRSRNGERNASVPFAVPRIPARTDGNGTGGSINSLPKPLAAHAMPAVVPPLLCRIPLPGARPVPYVPTFESQACR